MAQNLSSEKKFGKICEIKDRQGTYFVVRKGRNNSRVVPMDNVNGEGELIKTPDILKERDYEDPKEKAEKEARAKAKDAEKAEADAKADASTESEPEEEEEEEEEA